jgi:hypothetical protein
MAFVAFCSTELQETLICATCRLLSELNRFLELDVVIRLNHRWFFSLKSSIQLFFKWNICLDHVVLSHSLLTERFIEQRAMKIYKYFLLNFHIRWIWVSSSCPCCFMIVFAVGRRMTGRLLGRSEPHGEEKISTQPGIVFPFSGVLTMA